MQDTRPGRLEDMAAIADIYNHYILNTTITFETEAVSEEDRHIWFQQFSEDGPHRILVIEEAGGIMGFATSVRYHQRAAYYPSVMTSVYVRDGHAGKGIGGGLYSDLLNSIAGHPDLHRAYALISLPNLVSIKLHEKLGFKKVGMLNEAGRKFDRFISVQIMEKAL